MRLRRREHTRSVTAVVHCAGEVTARHERCEFAGGRDDLDDGGGNTTFGGRDGAPHAPEPGWPVDRGELTERLREFTSWIGGPVELHHRVVATGRCVVAGTGRANESVRTVFAMTGGATVPGGRTLPVGFSGPGTGMDVLEDRRFAESIARTRDRLGVASGPVRGTLPAVLSPQAAGVLVHEAVGHYAEAMHVGAPAVHRLFTRIASERLSVVDESDQSCCDDEGVRRLGPTEIVRGGVLVAQLHNRATARAAATAPTGNARAALVWDVPIPRVSTLVCSAGTRPEAELVDALATGVYVHRVADGYRHGTRISARVVLGEHVKGGRRTGEYFTGSQIVGGLGLLVGLVELGDRAERGQNAMCGKDGQLLFDVGTVAPAIRLAELSLA